MSEPEYRPGHFVWRELMTTDVAKAGAFYTTLFGWKLEDMPVAHGSYGVIHNGGTPIGGIMAIPEGGPPVSGWTSYASVPDVDAAAERVKAEGGMVCAGPMTAPGVGRFGTFLDPSGAMFSLIKQERGDGPGGRPALHAFCWETCSTTNVAGVVPFYEKVVGWTSREVGPGMRLFFAGENMLADIDTAPPGQPARWFPHVFVMKLDDSRARATSLGATVLAAEVPVPGQGRLSVLLDPTGAHFSMFEPAMAG